MSRKRNKSKAQERTKAQQTAQAAEAKKSTVSFMAITYAVLAVVLIGGALFLLNSGRNATDEELEALKPSETVQVHSINNNAICFEAQDAKAGVIFYPGERTQAEAYAPLLHELASKGITCVLEPMPFNIPLLRADAANGVQEALPNITNWYMAGHSIGGSVAIDYANDHADAFAGVITLGSVESTKETKDSLRALSMVFEMDNQMAQKAEIAKQVDAFVSE